MRILSSKKLYLPALSIIAVVFLLLVLISASTYRNLDREKTMAMHFLYRQGVALLRSIEASARTGMKMLMWQEISLGSLMQETAKDKDIAYVYIIDDEGFVAHHSDPSKEGKKESWIPSLNRKDQVVTQIKTNPDGNQIFDIAKFFSPMYEQSLAHLHKGMMVYGETTAPHTHRGDTIILGLHMTPVSEARRADIQHAVIMAAIILVLGSGALFFIFVIQNYYLVERTLSQTQDFTRQVLANMANGLLSIDTDGKITSYNPMALQLLGLDEAGIKAVDFAKIVDFQQSGVDKTLKHCYSILEKEIKYRRTTGDMIPLAMSATPILGKNDRCQGAVIILRDLSEIKQLEERVRRSEKLAAIGELAAGVAHEIRNPLSSIRGFAQFLRHSLKDRPKEQEYAGTMVAEVDRINKVVTDLLTFARPMETELMPTDLKNLFQHTVRLVQADAQSRNITITILNSADNRELMLDSNQLTQAFLNLLLNSLQAVEFGGQIQVGANINNHTSLLNLWVEDDGVGIQPELKEKVFDPFFTTKEGGTGLGLAIVHKIAENHHGDVKIESPPTGKHRGCRFTIIIPINYSKNTPAGSKIK